MTGLPDPAFIGPIRVISKISVDLKTTKAMGNLGTQKSSRDLLLERPLSISCFYWMKDDDISNNFEEYLEESDKDSLILTCDYEYISSNKQVRNNKKKLRPHSVVTTSLFQITKQ